MWDASGKRGHSGTVVVGYQPAGSMAKHKELRDSGLEGWSSITPEFRVPCMAWGQTAMEIQQDFPVQRRARQIRDALTQKLLFTIVGVFLVGSFREELPLRHCNDVTGGYCCSRCCGFPKGRCCVLPNLL